ncbi:MAG: bifunctional adenosylcobinamide kinase/adenosylcobinamide-phosphate guanylyltransferase [Acidimicrobiales bacterium]
MALTLLLGGARSGKSALAVRMAAAVGTTGAPVVVIATAEARDQEMAARIARHRAQRPSGWITVEAPMELGAALDGADPASFVIVDCLTLWVTNLGEHLDDAEVIERAGAAAAVAAARPGPTVVVSNEVGSGIVPFDPAVRAWRDLLGSVNTTWATVADRVALVVAGRVLPLSRAEDMLHG